MVEDSTSEFSFNGEVAPFNDPAAPSFELSPVEDSATRPSVEVPATKYTT